MRNLLIECGTIARLGFYKIWEMLLDIPFLPKRV
jgi:hypothetical protein